MFDSLQCLIHYCDLEVLVSERYESYLDKPIPRFQIYWRSERRECREDFL